MPHVCNRILVAQDDPSRRMEVGMFAEVLTERLLRLRVAWFEKTLLGILDELDPYRRVEIIEQFQLDHFLSDFPETR